MVAMERGKKQCLSYHSKSSYEEEKLHQKLESYKNQTTTVKIGLIGSVQGEIKHHNLKDVNF